MNLAVLFDNNNIMYNVIYNGTELWFESSKFLCINWITSMHVFIVLVVVSVLLSLMFFVNPEMSSTHQDGQGENH